MVAFFDIVDFTADKIENDGNILPSLLKLFSMFNIKYWWNTRGDYLKQTVENFATRCSNCGKEKIIDVDFLDTTYQDIITTFVLNTMLHHVGMIWIIENNKDLKYDMDILNSDYMTGGQWYNIGMR